MDGSNGYEAVALNLIAAPLPDGAAVLDLGCGCGEPIAVVLVELGLAVFGVDASATMIAAFRARFPDAQAECATVEASAFFGRNF